TALRPALRRGVSSFRPAFVSRFCHFLQATPDDLRQSTSRPRHTFGSGGQSFDLDAGLVLAGSYVRRRLRTSQASQPNAPMATRPARMISAIMGPPMADPGVA